MDERKRKVIEKAAWAILLEAGCDLALYRDTGTLIFLANAESELKIVQELKEEFEIRDEEFEKHYEVLKKEFERLKEGQGE